MVMYAIHIKLTEHRLLHYNNYLCLKNERALTFIEQPFTCAAFNLARYRWSGSLLLTPEIKVVVQRNNPQLMFASDCA